MPRRSVLYMPGANTRALEKARTLPCDAIIFDLEDAVAPASKSQARTQVAASLEQGGYAHRELIVRINALDTPWGADDLQALAHLPMHGMLFPKVESTAQIATIDGALTAAGQPDLHRWYMIETPLALLDLRELVAASSQLTALVLGTSDLVKELRAQHVPARENLRYALQRCVVVARAYGLDVLDGVHLDFRDLESFEHSCRDARAMGFDGKTLIHPGQIEIANAVFGPDADAIAHAHRVLAAWESAQDGGKGVVELDGQLVENLHADEARRVIEFAEQLARRAS